MDDNSKKIGIADNTIAKKSKGDRIYFDGIGFCIVDDKEEGKILLRFTHK